MGFGKIFKNLWDKAPAPIKQKVASVAVTAKSVYKISKPAVQKFIADPKGTSLSALKQGKAIGNSLINQAVAIAKKNASAIARTVTKKIASAKQKAQKNRAQAAKIFNNAKTAATPYYKSAKSLAKSAYNSVKKGFTPLNIVRKAIQICPISGQGYALAETGHKLWKEIKSDKSLKSKAIHGLSAVVAGAKNIKDVVGYYNDIKKATGPISAIKSIKKSTLSGFKGGLALDFGVGAITGGLDALANNVGKNLSKSNVTGRVAFGAAKGVSKAGLAAGMGAATGAAIGGVIGLFAGGVTAAPAAAGAKLGATFLTPLFEKPAEWLTDKIFTEKNEERAGRLGEKVSAGVKGVWGGALNLIRGPN